MTTGFVAEGGPAKRAFARLAAGLIALSVLAGCGEEVVEPPPVPPAPEVPLPPPVPEPPVVIERSAESQALTLHYQRLQNDLLVQGLLRGDGGGPDTPFTDVMLARNFVRIALYDEYAPGTGTSTSEPTLSRLRRWDQPIRMQVTFGATVPLDQRDRDRASIASYASRLSRLSGVPIRQIESNGNFDVLVLNEDDRLGYEAQLRALVPGIADSSVRAFLNMPRSTLCLVIAFSEGGAPTYSRAVAVIRGEHPDLLRLSCIHEELAQGMGLANDSPQARPSIFNDDEEFGLLTTQDEMMLKMLYDPRLTPGMSAAEAAPIARQIATELVGGPS